MEQSTMQLLRSDTDPYCSSNCIVLLAHAVKIFGGNVVRGMGRLCMHTCLSACMSLFTCSLCCEVEGYGKGSSATTWTFCPCLNGVHCKWL